MLAPFFAFGQKFEVAVGGGISTNTQPTGNMYYIGNASVANYAATASCSYNSWTGWQLGLSIHELELASTSSVVFTDANYPTITYGGNDKKFVYSAYTTSACGFVNKKAVIGRSDLYIGFAIGFALAKNDPDERGPNESYKAPDDGNGLVLGMQFGYNYNFTPLFALTLDVAPRYYDLHYNVVAPHEYPSTSNLDYQIWAVPVTLGFRFRIQSADRTNPMYDYERYRRHHQRYRLKQYRSYAEPSNSTETHSSLNAK